MCNSGNDQDTEGSESGRPSDKVWWMKLHAKYVNSETFIGHSFSVYFSSKLSDSFPDKNLFVY